MEDFDTHFPGYLKTYGSESLAKFMAQREYYKEIHHPLVRQSLETMVHSGIGDVYGGNVWDNLTAIQKYFVVQTYNTLGPDSEITKESISKFFDSSGGE